jgi:nucleotide-binding universal stress UspA family protein
MTAFKDLLVTIDASREGRQRLAIAIALAERGRAHLTACYRAIAFEPTAASDLAETGRVSHEGTLAKTVEQHFQEDLARFDLSGTWLVTGERPLDDVVGHTRTVDLAIVGLGDPDRVEDNPQGFQPEDLILAAGRPVLGIPTANVPKRLGSTVLVAWEGSRAACRAMNDALPLLAAAERVIVLSIGAEDRALPMAEAAAAHLRRHGVPAEPSAIEDDDLGIGDVILAHADRLNADLVVAGAYGHSRMSHAILGGVSRTLLRQMMVPVLMSH